MNIWDWLADPRLRRWALPVAAGVALVVAIAVGATMWHRSQESRGEVALAAASVLVQQATAPEAPPDARDKAIAALDGVLREHPRFSAPGKRPISSATSATPRVRMARRVAPTSWRSPRAGGIASRAQRARHRLHVGGREDYTRAATAYESALKAMPPKTFLYEDALLALARVQELGGKPALAAETYQRVLKEVPDTRRADDLKTRLAALKSRQ